MSHRRLGIAVVINNVKFQPRTLPDRTGSDVDAANINQRLQEMGFDVEHLTNVTVDEIVTKIAES